MKRIFALLLLACLATGAGAAGKSANPYVMFETSDGTVYLEFYPQKAPKTVANFLQYVKDGHYDGVLFHRVIPGFVAQGGGYGTDFKEKTTRGPIENESKNGLSNLRGTIAMARETAPHTAAAQWYINLADNPNLDGNETKWGYTVFGKVVRGMAVIDSIAEIPTGPAGPFDRDVPFRPVVVKKATVVEQLPAPEQDGAAAETGAKEKAAS